MYITTMLKQEKFIANGFTENAKRHSASFSVGSPTRATVTRTGALHFIFISLHLAKEGRYATVEYAN